MLHTALDPRTGIGSRGADLVPSRLSERLAAGRPEVADAFGRARRTVLAGQRLDVGALAAGLGVDRTSLFRWVGSRDDLLAEVLWSVAAPTLDRVDAAAGAAAEHGARRVVSVLTGFVEAMISADFFRDLLAREPVRALRLLTTAASHVQRRFTAVVEELLERELPGHPAAGPLPRRDLAQLLVRIAESFAYADLLTGEAPDAERARAAFTALLSSTRG